MGSDDHVGCDEIPIFFHCLSMALFRVLPVIENRMNDNFLAFDAIEYRKGESPDHATSEVRISDSIHFREIDDVAQGHFDTIKKFETKPPPLHFVPLECHLDIIFRPIRIANLHVYRFFNLS